MNTIRPARLADAVAIADIYVETWQTSYPGMVPDNVLIGLSPDRIASSWRRAIQRRHGSILVAEADAQSVIGFGSVGPNRDKSSPFDCEVYTLYVRPDFQDQGAGRRLLHGLFQETVEQGFRHCELWVLAANPSRFFYHAMGGRLCGEKYERLWGEDVRELAFGWQDIHALEGIQSR